MDDVEARRALITSHARRLQSRQQRGESSRRTLDHAMAEPSTVTPDVVVLSNIEQAEVKAKDMGDPKKDLWLTTADDRYNSPMIEIRVGPHAKTFAVHKAILTKSDFFSKALDGGFMESNSQSIDLPEENPDIFTFLVAFLYEDKFVPIKPVSTVLVAQPDKGKGREEEPPQTSTAVDDNSDSGSGSDEDIRPLEAPLDNYRWNNGALYEIQPKDGSRHRPECRCAACVIPSCHQCGASQLHSQPRHPHAQIPGMPIPMPVPPHPQQMQNYRAAAQRAGPQAYRFVPVPTGTVTATATAIEEQLVEDGRMSSEDMRTWAMAYGLSIEVYLCANRYCLPAFKERVAAYVINSFEVAGLEAAIPPVLYSCRTLYNGVSPVDPLLQKVFARVGFLQARLWKNCAEETHTFFQENPELAMLIMKEMVERGEADRVGTPMGGDGLPPMERPARELRGGRATVGGEGHWGHPPNYAVPRYEPYYGDGARQRAARRRLRANANVD